MSNTPIKETATNVVEQLNIELCQLSTQEEREAKAKQIIKHALKEQESDQVNRLYQNISRLIHPDKSSSLEKPCVKAFDDTGKLQEILINVKSNLFEKEEELIDSRTMSETFVDYLKAPQNFLDTIFGIVPIRLENDEDLTDQEKMALFNDLEPSERMTCVFNSLQIELETKFPILFKHHEYPQYIDQTASFLSGAISVLAATVAICVKIASIPPQILLSTLTTITQALLSNFSAFKENAQPYHRRAYMKIKTPLAPEQEAWTDEQLDNLFDASFTISTTEKQQFLYMNGITATGEFSEDDERTFQRLYIPAYQVSADSLGIPVTNYYFAGMTDEAVADLYNEIREEQNSTIQKTALETTPLFMSVLNTYKNLFKQNEEAPSTAIKQAMFICSQLVKAVLFTPLALASLSVAFVKDVLTTLVSLTTQAIIGLKFVSALIISAPLYMKDAITTPSEDFSHKNIPVTHRLTLFAHAEMLAETKENDEDMELNGLNSSM